MQKTPRVTGFQVFIEGLGQTQEPWVMVGGLQTVQAHDGIESGVVGFDLFPVGHEHLDTRDLTGVNGVVQGLGAERRDVRDVHGNEDAFRGWSFRSCNETNPSQANAQREVQCLLKGE